MRRRHLTHALPVLAFVTLAAAARPVLAADACDGKLGVTLDPAMAYASKDGSRFTARYGSLSDGSLQFVKVKAPGGKEYTLPAAPSGSGARYTDERTATWWEHQGVIRFEIMDQKGDWVAPYGPLRPQAKAR